MRVLRTALIAATVCVATTAAAQGEASRLNFTGALSMDLPLKALGNDAGTGIGLMIRNSTRRSGAFNIRTGLAFDRFSGKGTIDNIQFFTFFGGDLVHNNGDHFYQFVGIGVYNTRVSTRSNSNSLQVTAPPDRQSSGFDFGFNGGIGGAVTIAGTGFFVEAALVHILSSGPATSWVPVRFGVKL